LIGHFSWGLDTLIRKTPPGIGRTLLRVLDAVLPDLENFNIKTEVVQSLPLPPGFGLGAAGYAVVYTAFVLLLMAGKTSLAPAALLLLLGGLAGFKVGLDGMPRAKIPGAGIVYLPSGPAVKAAAFGFSSLTADVSYVWAIQYYGNTAVPDRRRHFNRIFEVIADLDPSWIDPYLTAALIAHHDFRDPELALKMYDDGAYCQLYLRDYERAKGYYRKAMDLPGAPPIARRLFANAAFKTMDYQTSWETWREVYETAPDREIKKIAGNHLYNIKAAVDIADLARRDGRCRGGRQDRHQHRRGQEPRRLLPPPGRGGLRHRHLEHPAARRTRRGNGRGRQARFHR